MGLLEHILRVVAHLGPRQRFAAVERYLEEKNLGQAYATAQPLLEENHVTYGADRSEFARVLGVIASLARDVGNLQEAEGIYRRAIAELGDDRLDETSLLSGLAESIYLQQRRRAEARQLAKDVLRKQVENKFPANVIAERAGWLGDVAHHTRDRAAAHWFYRFARNHMLPDEVVSVVYVHIVYGRLCAFLLQRGNTRLAENLAEEFLVISQRLSGQSEETAEAILLLAEINYVMDNPARAWSLLAKAKALASWKEFKSAQANADALAAMFLVADGKTREGVEKLRAYFEDTSSVLPNSFELTIRVVASLLNCNELDLADRLLYQAYGGVRRRVRADILFLQSMVARRRQAIPRAEALLRTAISMIDAGRDARKLANWLELLATLVAELGGGDEAESLRHGAKLLREQQAGAITPTSSQ